MSKIDLLAKNIKKYLIEEKKVLFIDTNVYKYYTKYKTLEKSDFIKEYQNKANHAIDLEESKRIFDFIIKNKIIVKKNEILESEIKKIIKNAKNIKEKYYLEELENKIIFDKNITINTPKEKEIAEQLAPRTKRKDMRNDFKILICCKKDNTSVLLTKDRDDFRKCEETYNKYRNKFTNIKKDFHIIKLDKFDLIINKIEKGGDKNDNKKKDKKIS